MYRLVCSNLSRHYQTLRGSVTPLKNVSFTLEPGRLAAVLGKSGSGKTTLLRLIAGFETPDSGAISFQSDLNRPPVISVVFQEPRLFPWMTVEQNLRLALRHHTPSEQTRKIQEALDLVRLPDVEAAYPDELSGGMAQRVGIARALCRKPDILLMDEAFSALDALTRSALQREFMRIHEEHPITTLLITHDVSEAVLLANDIFYLEGGHIDQHLVVDLPKPRTLATPGVAQMTETLLDTILQKKDTSDMC